MKNLIIIILLIFTTSVFAKAKASDEAIEKQKKLCAAKGKKYWKSKNSCKKSDSKEKRKCLKAKGEWKYNDNESDPKGECKGAKSKKQIRCEKKKGTYNVETKTCKKLTSKKELKKLEKKCRKNGFVFDIEAKKCTEKMTEKRSKCEESQGKWSRGKCKKNKALIKKIKAKCKKEGWRYLKKENKCSEVDVSKARKKCEKRYKFQESKKIDAKWDNGSCTISKKESKSAAKAMKAYCKSKGYKFDRLLQMCPEFTKKVDFADIKVTKKQKKEARNKSKVKKEECFKSGFKYEKYKGECSEEKKHKKASKCEKRGGSWKDGVCEGAMSGKEFRKNKRLERKDERKTAKWERKNRFKNAKLTFKECLKDKNKTKQYCKKMYKLEKRYIKAKYKDHIFKGEEFKSCVDNALKIEETKESSPDTESTQEISKEASDTAVRHAVNICFRKHYNKTAKKALIGALWTASYALLPGAGLIGGAGGKVLGWVGIVFSDQIKRVKSNTVSKLQKIQDDILNYVKEEAMYEKDRITQPMIEDLLADVRKEYYKSLGYTEQEIQESEIALTKGQDKKRKRIEKLSVKHWAKNARKEAKQNYKKCISAGKLSKDQCKFQKRVTLSLIKAKAKTVKSSILRACLNEADDDKKKVECYHNSAKRNTKIGSLLVLTEVGIWALNTGPKLNEYIDKRIEKHISKFSSSSIKSALQEASEPIKKEFIEELNTASVEVAEKVLPSDISDKGAALVDTRLTLFADKVGLDGVDVGIAAGVGSAEAKAQKTFDQMKKEAIEQAKVQFDACKADKDKSNYQCRQINVINKRFIKSKFNSGILRGNNFSQCLEKKDNEHKGKIGSAEHKLAINECFIERNGRIAKAGIISGAVVTSIIIGGKIAFEVNQKAVRKLSQKLIKDNLEAFVRSQGYDDFEDGESFKAEDIDAYAMGIGEQKAIDFVNKQFKAIEEELIKSKSTRSLFELGAIPEECIREADKSSTTPSSSVICEDKSDLKKHQINHFQKIVGALHVAVVTSATALASSVGGTIDLKVFDELEDQIEKEYLAKIGKIGVQYLSRKEKKTLRKKKKLGKEDLKSKFESGAQAAYGKCVRENSTGKCEKGYIEYKKVIKAIFANKIFAGAKFRICIEEALKDLRLNQEISQKQITEVNKCYYNRKVKRAITSSGVVLFVGVGAAIKLKDTAATDWIQKHIYNEIETKYIVNVKQYFNGNTEEVKNVIAKAVNRYREQMFFDYWNETTEAGLDLASQIAGLQELEEQWNKEVASLQLKVVKEAKKSE